MTKIFLTFIGIFFIMVAPVHGEDNFYQLEAKSIDGEIVKFSSYKGQALLIVNVASRCGYTSQYEGLQKLYARFKDKGLVVLGFPCNDFGGQEPGTEAEIKNFCSSTYGADFPLFSKVSVLGAAKSAIYKFLIDQSGGGDVSWNFEKFLVDRQGRVAGRFPSRVRPEDEQLVKAIEGILG
jgi:glutathione peroxidase